MKRVTLIGITAAAAVLTACGGSGGGMIGTPAPAEPAPKLDAFFSLVAGQLLTTSEDREPVAIDAFAVTSPETDEPAPL